MSSVHYGHRPRFESYAAGKREHNMPSATVRAARLREHGKPLAVETVELPTPGPDEVRVEMEFAGVNPVDRYMAEGRVAPDGPLPRTLGSEGAGTAAGRPVLVAGGGL